MRIRYKIFNKVTVAAFLAIFLAACGSATTAGDDGEGPVRIGWMGPLTGTQAPWGTSESSAVQMFFDQLNEEGGLLGRQVEVVALDNQADALETINIVNRLATLENVFAIIGTNASGPAIASAGAVTDHQVPTVATLATNPHVTINPAGGVNPFNFRATFMDIHEGTVAAGFAFNHLNARRAAILVNMGSDYSQGVAEAFANHFTALGGEIITTEGFNEGDVDFRPQLTSINNTDPDLIFKPVFFNDAALASQQSRELGITAILMGAGAWPSALLYEMSGGAVEGAYVVHHLDTSDPDVAWLRDMYMERFDREPEINLFLAWDAATMIVEAVERAGSFDRVAIRDEILNTNFVGVTGPIIISPETNSPEGKQAAILTIQDGEFVFVQNYIPTLP